MSESAGQTPAEHLARFGLSSFRPGQEDVIRAVLSGRDCLCVMPTGGGKSLCYQLPAIARDGVTLVVSPLIALMKDQVDALRAINMRAAYINSSLAPAEQFERLEQMAAGQLDLVYVAPERLRSGRFLEAVKRTRVQLLAVDEAHCISEWGHDFRPDYARLGRLRQLIGGPQTIALTATATPHVRGDIAKLLALREPAVFITGFARPNLQFEVQRPRNQPEKDVRLLKFLSETPGSGIIYASTRKRCEEIAESLTGRIKRRVGLYHAGLAPDERRRIQEAFMQSQIDVIVATNAFGMGIDKADLRFVVHYTMPGSIEAYYQEAGRAGRDGNSSRCLLLYHRADRYIQEFFIDNHYPPREVVAQVYKFLCSIEQDPIELTQQEIKERLNLSIGGEGVGACEQLLEKCGALERLDARENMASVRIDSDLPTLVDLLPKEAKNRRKLLQAVESIVGERRGERVYLPVEAIAARAELDRGAVLRGLRELNRLKNFDYVPPFRGRGVHILDRERPFNDLQIDFDELDARKAAEYDKLDRVVQYASTRHCRQEDIRRYFGDPDKSKCGTCDNCGATQAPGEANKQKAAANSAASPTADAGVHAAVLMVLSGVARTQGRFGKTLIAKMLCGSQATQVTKLNLHKLSTFGLLRDLKQDEAVALIDALLSVGLLDQTEPQKFRPVVQLTERGAAVMKGQTEFDASLPLSRLLVDKLRYLRIDGKPSPAAHEEPAARPERQTSAPSFDEHRASPDAAFPHTTSPAAGNGAAPGDIGPESHYWTWKLLSAGFTFDECRQIRRLEGDEILRHAIVAQREGRAVDLNWFLTPRQSQWLATNGLRADANHPSPAGEPLPLGLRPLHLQLFQERPRRRAQ